MASRSGLPPKPAATEGADHTEAAAAADATKEAEQTMGGRGKRGPNKPRPPAPPSIAISAELDEEIERAATVSGLHRDEVEKLIIHAVKGSVGGWVASSLRARAEIVAGGETASEHEAQQKV
jgi:hypothetical protein